MSDHCYMCRMTSRTVAELRVEGHPIDEAIKVPVFHLPLTTEVDEARQQGAADERAAIVEMLRCELVTWKIRYPGSDVINLALIDEVLAAIQARATTSAPRR